METLTWSQAVTFWNETAADIAAITASMLALATLCADDPDAMEQIYMTLTETARMCKSMLTIFA
jgi:hypothetical protein